MLNSHFKFAYLHIYLRENFLQDLDKSLDFFDGVVVDKGDPYDPVVYVEFGLKRIYEGVCIEMAVAYSHLSKRVIIFVREDIQEKDRKQTTHAALLIKHSNKVLACHLPIAGDDEADPREHLAAPAEPAARGGL